MLKIKPAYIMLPLIIMAGISVYAIEQKIMSIQVRTAVVRSNPTFLGKIVARLPYGDRVSVQATQGDWRLVNRAGTGADGWMHSSALTTKKIVLQPGTADVQQAASSDEITLAGKGFNQQVEDDFKSRNPQTDFTWVNKMEAMAVSQNQIQAFIKEGQLTPEGEE